MLLLFAGEHYYPQGGWDDFIKVIGSLEELEIRVERTIREVPAFGGYRIIENSQERWEGAREAGTIEEVRQYINVHDSAGDEYKWWHVADTETATIVAASRP